LTGWAFEYLELLRKDSSLCLPTVDLVTVASILGIPEKTLRSRRSYRDDVRKTEREIVAEHMGRLKAQAAVRAREKDAPKGPEGNAENGDLPLALERYLELYAETDDRLAAVRALQEEGVPITLDDVFAAAREYPAFGRALERQWKEGHVEAEDKLRGKARKGQTAALPLYLRGNMPEKYGHKVKVDVAVTHQLGDEDRHLVEGVKERYLPPPRRRQPEEVVEGVVLREGSS